LDMWSRRKDRRQGFTGELSSLVQGLERLV
jgi:hypothetical protein